MIRVLQVTEDHSPANTGITSMVDALVQQIQPVLPQTVLSTGDNAIPLPGEAKGFQLPIQGVGRAWRAAPGANRVLEAQVSQADVIHLHGAWMWVQWAAARAAARQRKPFLLSLHGMLEPWMWQRQSWLHRLKKTIYWWGVAYPAFRQAHLVHAIHPGEARNLRTYLPHVPIEVIGHSLNLEAIDLILADIPLVANPEPYILFLGRLHPKKGIDLLIQAFARLESPRLKLKIAGPVEARQAAYAARLEKMVQEAGLGPKVEFLGEVQGAQKWALLRDAWVFCLPSYSEAIGMVNPEAAACRTPVITTPATGLDQTWVDAGGMLVDTDPEALAQALKQAQAWTAEERAHRGERLYQLVETTYSWKATSTRWINLYKSLAGNR